MNCSHLCFTGLYHASLKDLSIQDCNLIFFPFFTNQLKTITPPALFPFQVKLSFSRFVPRRRRLVCKVRLWRGFCLVHVHVCSIEDTQLPSLFNIRSPEHQTHKKQQEWEKYVCYV